MIEKKLNPCDVITPKIKEYSDLLAKYEALVLSKKIDLKNLNQKIEAIKNAALNIFNNPDSEKISQAKLELYKAKLILGEEKVVWFAGSGYDGDVGRNGDYFPVYSEKKIEYALEFTLNSVPTKEDLQNYVANMRPANLYAQLLAEGKDIGPYESGLSNQNTITPKYEVVIEFNSKQVVNDNDSKEWGGLGLYFLFNILKDNSTGTDSYNSITALHRYGATYPDLDSVNIEENIENMTIFGPNAKMMNSELRAAQREGLLKLYCLIKHHNYQDLSLKFTEFSKLKRSLTYEISEIEKQVDYYASEASIDDLPYTYDVSDDNFTTTIVTKDYTHREYIDLGDKLSRPTLIKHNYYKAENIEEYQESKKLEKDVQEWIDVIKKDWINGQSGNIKDIYIGKDYFGRDLAIHFKIVNYLNTRGRITERLTNYDLPVDIAKFDNDNHA